MRRLLLIGLALVLLAGCKKATDKVAKNDNPSTGGPNQPNAPASTGTVTNPGGGGFAAVQAVRGAVIRTVNLNELNSLRTFILGASPGPNGMPTVADIKADLRRLAPKTYQLVESGAIVLTDPPSRDGIWAFTADPQTPAGEYLVLTASEIRRSRQRPSTKP